MNPMVASSRCVATLPSFPVDMGKGDGEMLSIVYSVGRMVQGLDAKPYIT